MGELTERGQLLAEGFSALADANGDDTLNRPADSAEPADAEQSGQVARAQGDVAESTPATSPAPVTESADDAAAKEIR